MGFLFLLDIPITPFLRMITEGLRFDCALYLIFYKQGVWKDIALALVFA
jgi:hypothetical protein